MGQITDKYDFLSRVNLKDLSTIPTPAAGEHILVSSDNSMNAAGQGYFDCYIVGDGQKAATELELQYIGNDKDIIDDEYVIARAFHAHEDRIKAIEESGIMGEDEERVIAEALCDLKNGNKESSRNTNNFAVKFCCLGDSITSNKQSNTGGVIHDILGVTYLKEGVADCDESICGNVTSEFGNLAVSHATLADKSTTTIQLLKGDGSASANNTLSNQVRRLLQHTTARDAQITWTYNKTTYSIPTSDGVGKGYTSDIPDIIYIAMGTNDKDLTDDLETVMTTSYDDLTRHTIPSAMRWAIETLRMAYPKAQIFIETPPCYSSDYDFQNARAELIKKCAKRLHTQVVDAFNECGQSYELIRKWTNGSPHPYSDGKELVGQYVAGRIKSGYGKLI